MTSHAVLKSAMVSGDELTEEFKAELDRRKKDADEHREDCITWEEFRKTLNLKTKKKGL